MNLQDYKKVARAMFAGPHDRELELFLEQVWDSATRSGASSAGKARNKNCLIDEWEWDDEWDGLVDYVARELDVRCDQAAVICKSNLEDIRLWARAKGERKVDWTSALKGWMRRSWVKQSHHQGGKQQADLFQATSLTPSAALSKAEADHKETFRKAMEINNSNLELRSRCSTSSATDSPRTPPALPVSSRTPH